MKNNNGPVYPDETTAQRRVPKLRFPEFLAAPEWDNRRIGYFLIGQSRETAKPDKPYTGLGIRSHGKGTFLKKFQKPEKNSMDRLYTVESNDLIVNITFAWEGAIAIANDCDHGALVSHRFPTYTFNPSKANSNFVRQIITTKDFVYSLFLISPGGAGRNRVMNKKDFLDIKILLPSLPEQQKIADCLSSLDELISAQAHKLNTLKAHKKGLMQQLFPAEGETVPKLRFSEFRDAPKWDEKSIGEVITLEYGSSLSEQNRKYGTIPVIGSNGVVGYHDQYLVEGPAIVIGRKGSAGQVNWIISDCCPIDTTFYVKNKSPDDYLMSFLRLTLEKSNLERLKDNGVVPGLNRNEVYSIKSSFPKPQEQQKIAGCLSSLDELIAAQSKKLDTLKTHKKGLMQQLFPSAVEVNG